MNKEELDFIVDCHISSWKTDKNYNIDLFGHTWDEKEYIIENFKRKTREINMDNKLMKMNVNDAIELLGESIKENALTIGETFKLLSKLTEQSIENELNEYKKEVIVLPKGKEYLLGDTSFSIKNFYKKSGQLPTYNGTPIIIVD